jgi:hypothetical protein
MASWIEGPITGPDSKMYSHTPMIAVSEICSKNSGAAYAVAYNKRLRATRVAQKMSKEFPFLCEERAQNSMTASLVSRVHR